MAKQTFTTGQVLTAAQMTSLQANDYNQTVSAKTANYVLVAADAGTTITMNSASATTITVNTSLFTAGDTLRIQNIGAGACVVTAGTATVTSAGSLSIPQWGGGTLYFTTAAAAVYFPNAATGGSGLTLITAQTIGSAVSSVTVTNAFSATYDAYRIVITGGTASSSNGEINVKLGASVTGYYNTTVYTTYNTTVAAVGNSNGTSWTYVGLIDASTNSLCMDIQNPFLAKYTTFQSALTRTSIGGSAVGIHQVNTSYTDFVITPSAGTLTGGTIRVYGLANS
jgi:hypothetical protein